MGTGATAELGAIDHQHHLGLRQARFAPGQHLAQRELEGVGLDPLQFADVDLDPHDAFDALLLGLPRGGR